MNEPNAILDYCERERARFRGQTFPNKRAELRLREIALIEATDRFTDAIAEGKPAGDLLMKLTEALAALEVLVK